MIHRSLVVLAAVLFPGFAGADYTLALEEVGKRQYYCQITVALTNETQEPLTEINAFFLNFVGEEQVGRSKGASFSNVAPGGTVTATFETPHAPCTDTSTDVESYRMIIGACRLGLAFEDKSVCAEKMRLAPPFVSAEALN